MREVINGLLYLLWTGCQWQALPKDLPPKSTVHHYFKLWDWDGTLERIHHALYVAVREQAGREVYCGPVLRHSAELMLPAVDLGGRVWLGSKPCKGGPAAPAFGG